ncbi:tRNA (guanine(10)-N2)-methyltransferase homolog [Exaiptasia diaphana]|uniref:tRNA (guanine(10)-N(2))-methyltransferase TRMT11 n=1 Tax=Exaiptasia diaphana TaxID=2652724 RepID=A0A913XKD5_EXADI|nr:tRNA (guanine(10)-N2)-methyltransferase homolog [Exaiptasia diaphana]
MKKIMADENEETSTFLVLFAQEHVDFRVPSPFLEIVLPLEDDAQKILSRSLSIKSLYELWGTGKTLAQLCENLKKYPTRRMQPYCSKEATFRINVETYNKKIPQSQREHYYEALSFLPFKGKVALDNPENQFSLVLDFGQDTNVAAETPCRYYFGRLIGKGQRHLCQKYSLKDRYFIGNTSMDPLLSFFMANQGQARPGTLVFDPFVGTGSTLLSCGHFGSRVFGSDIDKNLITGRGKSSRASSKCKWRKRDEIIRTNFINAGLEHLFVDVMVADASRQVLRPTPIFDAIITDPPYGVREGVRSQISEKELTENRSEAELGYPSIHLGRLSDIILSLLHFSSQYLCLNGRLVFWLPVYKPSYSDSKVPHHPCFRLVANSEQNLFTNISRHLLTMEKTHEYNKSVTMDSLRDKNREFEIMCDRFRENYFTPSNSS